MAKLTEAKLDEGRAFIRSHDLQGLLEWIDKTGVSIDRRVVWNTYQPLLMCRETERALKIFDSVFPHVNPMTERLVMAGTALLVLLFGVGVLGGIITIVKLFL